MKKIVAGMLMATFIIASTGLQAQRGGRGGGGNTGGSRSVGGGENRSGGSRSFGNGGGSSQASRSFSQSSTGRSFGQQPSRSFSQPQRNVIQSQSQHTFNQSQRSIAPQRDITTQQRSFQQQGSFRAQPNRSFGSGNRSVVVQNNFYGSRGGYGGYYPHYRPIGTYHYSRSPRLVVSIGGPYRTIPWLGIPYNYYNGYWYRPYGASFQVIAPPFGIRIGSLPFGYSPLDGPWGNYYYYNNVFYRHPINDNNQYEVVDAPLGAQVPELPKGAEVRVIDTQKYYELDGVFYKEDLRDGQIWYTVVGKNGVLSTQDDSVNNTTPLPSDNVGTGDRISVLPDGSKSITINGQQLYVSPNGTYYQQIIDGTNTWYEVVGQ